MFDRFTDRARKCMAYARQEALRLNQAHIDTEHLLLGILAAGSGVGALTLESLSGDASRVRLEVEKLAPVGATTVTMGQLPFTPHAKRALELSLEEATSLGHSYIGTEHLLLGLLREHDGVAAHALQNVGIGVEVARAACLKLLSSEGGTEKSGLERASPSSQTDDRRQTPGVAYVTDAAKEVFQVAFTEAHRLGDRRLGAEHLLLGILHRPDGIAKQALHNLNVNVDAIRDEILKLIAARA